MSYEEEFMRKRHAGSSTIRKIVRDLQLEEVIEQYNVQNNTHNLPFTAKVFIYTFKVDRNSCLCLNCKKEFIKKINLSKGIHGMFCSRKCSSASGLYKEAVKRKYGVSNVSQLPWVKEKKKQTNLKNSGVTHNWKLRDNKEFQKRLKLIMIERYGEDNASKVPSLRSKQRKGRFDSKNYIFPSGKTIQVQGYEYKFLDEYFSTGGLEENIFHGEEEIVNQIGQVVYEHLGKQRKYYPDFYLKRENKIIEVKSTYTYSNWEDVNQLKKQACELMGLNFEFKIY